MRPIIVAVLAFSTLSAQTVFEVASVKPSGPQSIRGSKGGPGTSDPGQFSFSSATLQDILYTAYALEDVQQIAGPSWLGEEKYDFICKIPPGTTKQQFRLMLQNLLAERFKMTLHHQTKDFPVYELVTSKNGPKLKASTEDSLAQPTAVKDGFPSLPAGRPSWSVNYDEHMHAHLIGREEPVAALVMALRNPAGRVIVDKTGLTGKYEFTLEFNLRPPGPGALDDDPFPSIFDAVQQQLGLKLEDKKAPFDVLVIDHAEKVPTEN
jgi:uncharacterized protein (TIGR03435 family)